MRVLFVLLILSSVSFAQETATQPNCEDIDGLKITDDKDIPDGYTGVAIVCAEGKVFAIIGYNDGKFDGLSRAWHANGQLAEESNSKDGKLEGLFQSWYENGQLESEGSYKNGEKDGLSRWWHENGQLSEEANYKDGELISEKCWDEDGNEMDCD